LVPAEVIERILTPHVNLPDIPGEPPISNGYGWLIVRDPARPSYFNFGGYNISGFFDLLVRYPEQGLTGIFLSNQEKTDIPELKAALDGMVFGEE
jgi:hypothetical protein